MSHCWMSWAFETSYSSHSCCTFEKFPQQILLYALDMWHCDVYLHPHGPSAISMFLSIFKPTTVFQDSECIKKYTHTHQFLYSIFPPFLPFFLKKKNNWGIFLWLVDLSDLYFYKPATLSTSYSSWPSIILEIFVILSYFWSSGSHALNFRLYCTFHQFPDNWHIRSNISQSLYV